MRGVVVLTGPGAHLLALGAWRPGEQFLEVGGSAGATAVLGRTRALAAGARRIRHSRVRNAADLGGEFVFATVAEVVLVSGPVPGRHHEAEKNPQVRLWAGFGTAHAVGVILAERPVADMIQGLVRPGKAGPNPSPVGTPCAAKSPPPVHHRREHRPG
jgi:hypothetical protein